MSTPELGWIDAGQLGRGRWICGQDGRQIAVFYGPTTNPKATDDLRLALAAHNLLFAAQIMMRQPQVRDATNNVNPSMAHAADELAAAIRMATGAALTSPQRVEP